MYTHTSLPLSRPAPGVRMKESDRTAFIFLPGGLGTMDGEGDGLFAFVGRGVDAPVAGLPAARRHAVLHAARACCQRILGGNAAPMND